MSTVFPRIDGFVGYGDGAEALLRSDEAWDSEHPLVKERPELFETRDAPPPVHAAAPPAKKARSAKPSGGTNG